MVVEVNVSDVIALWLKMECSLPGCYLLSGWSMRFSPPLPRFDH